MSKWSWRSSEGRSQTQQQQHLAREASRNRARDEAAKARRDENLAKGRSVPQQDK